jgi:hypothetical protein
MPLACDSSSNRLYCSAFVAGLLILVSFAAALTLVNRRNESLITLSPDRIDYTSQPFWEGDAFKLELALMNNARRTVTVESLEAACSCMRVVTHESRSLPLQLNAGEKVEIVVESDGLPAMGKQEIQILASGSAGDRAVRAASVVSLDVRRPLMADPPVVALGELRRDASKIRRRVTLWKADSADIRSVESIESSLDSIGVRLTAPSDLLAAHQRAGHEVLGDLEIEVDPGTSKRKISERVTVRFAGGKTLVIPVFGWVLDESKSVENRSNN